MNIEDLAKQDLFNFDQVEFYPGYDPYRNNNILKDSNRIQDNSTPNTNKTFYHSKNRNFCYESKNCENDMNSLKKRLERL